MRPLLVGLLGFDGLTSLDLIGPLEAFFAAYVTENGDGSPVHGYEPVVVGRTRRSFVSESGVVIRPHRSIDDAPRFDTIIVPGGPGLRQPHTQRWVADWITTQAARTRRIASICTGIYGIAPTGLLNGRRVTTHWQFAADVAKRFPALRVNADALYLHDGPFCTSAGVTAGIDLALDLIEADYGATTALGVARELVVFLKRPGGQEQFSEPLRFQTQSSNGDLADLGTWIMAHPGSDLSIPALAERACLSPRQLARRFRAAFGTTPAAFVEEVRLSEACRRLTARGASVKHVAASLGFASDDAFRRAFERRFGVAPSSYRARFRSTPGSRTQRSKQENAR